jgi:RNA-directed DNA polymerase
LHTKAKNSPDYWFYTLYDKIYRRDVLGFAYERCRANRGAPGVDDQSFDDIEKYGAARWLDELAEELKNEKYQSQPAKRVYIPKPNGKQRPLGIPCIKDRIVQMVEPIKISEPILIIWTEPVCSFRCAA